MTLLKKREQRNKALMLFYTEKLEMKMSQGCFYTVGETERNRDVVSI